MNRLAFAARRPAALCLTHRPWLVLLLALFSLLCVSTAHGQVLLSSSPYPEPIVTVGSGVDLTYTFELTETESVYLVQVDPGFPDYTIKDSSGCPIDTTGRTNTNAGTSCTIIVHFAPSVPGLRNAPLRVATTAGSIATPLVGYGDGPQGVIYPGGDSVFLGVFGVPGFNGDNSTQYKELNAPSSIAFDSGSRLYFADQGNYRIRRITLAGPLETVAGSGTAGFSGDGGPSTSAEIGAMVPGIALDSAQNIFFVDQANFRIREIGTYLSGFAAPTINTIIGSGTQASANGCAVLGPPNTPSFNTLYGIAVDQFEDVYFSDAGTGCIYRLQGEGDERGNITLIGGTGTKTSTGDGGMATSATFIQPGALALDSQQANLYVVDMGDYKDSSSVHHGKNIRKINLNTGIVTAVAGNGGSFDTYAGDGGLATAANFNEPNGLVLDAANNLYITESLHVRRIDAATGTITTVAGNTSFNGLSQIGAGGLHFQIASTGIALDNQGSYYLLEPSEAVIEKIDLSMPYLDFNTTAIGSTSIDSPQPLYLSNIGTQPLIVAGPAPVLSNSNFIINTTSPVTGYVPCATTTQSTAAFTLATGATCASTVSFVPSVQDNNNETATLTDNSLNATGGIAQGMTLVATSYGDPSAGTLLPTPVDYGQVTTGSSSTKSITFTNTGTSSLTFFGATVTTSGGQASTVFTQMNNCPSSLGVGASCVFSIVFAPTATGAQTTTLTVNSTIVGGNTASLTGIGADGVNTAPRAALTATASFGSVQTGGSSSQMLTLTNAGTAALPITSYTVTAGATQFAVASSTCMSSLAAGSSCTFTMSFTPVAIGAQSGTFSVTDSVGTQTASLTGTGTALAQPQAVLTPASANFGSVTAGTTSAAQIFTLANAGNAPLAIAGIKLTGTSSTAFTSTNTCGSTLAAGSSCTIAVTFSPGSAGSFAATLSVTDTVGTQTSSLTGSGAALSPAPDFTVTATPASQSVTSGSSATYNVTVASIGGTFAQGVLLTASGLPPGATVTFSPASVTPGGAGAQSTMIVQTAAQQVARGNRRPLWPFTAPVFAGLLLLFPGKTLRLGKKSRRVFTNLACIVALLGIAASTIGCGAGFALPSFAKTYTITVTGTSGSDTHSTTVTLIVQ